MRHGKNCRAAFGGLGPCPQRHQLAAAAAATAIVAAIIVAKQEKDDDEQDPGAVTVAKKSADAHLLSPPFVGYIPYYVAPRRLVTAYIRCWDGASYKGKGRKVWGIAIIVWTSPKGSAWSPGDTAVRILSGSEPEVPFRPFRQSMAA